MTPVTVITINLKILKGHASPLLFSVFLILVGIFFVYTETDDFKVGYVPVFLGLFVLIVNINKLIHNYIEVTVSSSGIKIRKQLLFQTKEISFSEIDEINEIPKNPFWEFDFEKVELCVRGKKYLFGTAFIDEFPIDTILDYWNSKHKLD